MCGHRRGGNTIPRGARRRFNDIYRGRARALLPIRARAPRTHRRHRHRHPPRDICLLVKNRTTSDRGRHLQEPFPPPRRFVSVSRRGSPTTFTIESSAVYGSDAVFDFQIGVGGWTVWPADNWGTKRNVEELYFFFVPNNFLNRKREIFVKL